MLSKKMRRVGKSVKEVPFLLNLCFGLGEKFILLMWRKVSENNGVAPCVCIFSCSYSWHIFLFGNTCTSLVFNYSIKSNDKSSDNYKKKHVP